MMFSATFDKNARKVAKDYMSVDHVRVRVGRAGSSHLNISQKVPSIARCDGWGLTATDRVD